MMEKRLSKIRVSLQGFIPVRKDPNERSEMVTQVLFGEYAEEVNEEGKWLYIRAENDNYEGWIDKKCMHKAPMTLPLHTIVSLANTSIKNITTGQSVILPVGSSLPETINGKFTIAENIFEVGRNEPLIQPGTKKTEELIESVISVPYLWGGRCGFGFDCSGLTQYLCRTQGIEIPRDAGDQSAVGTTLSFISESKTGDLAFFDNSDGAISHVGMMIGNNRIIHASGIVRIDRIDQQGIFNEQQGGYTHRLRVVKRVR